jgi:hypothetical protein
MGDEIFFCICVQKKKANSVLDEIESLNFADLQRDRPYQRPISETKKILPRRSEMWDGKCNVQLIWVKL